MQPQHEAQRQRQRGGTQRGDGGQLEAGQAPLRKTRQRQAEFGSGGLDPQQPQQHRHRHHEAQQHRRGTYRHGQCGAAAVQLHRPCIGAVGGPAARGGKAQLLLRPPLEPQQQAHQQQQHRSQLRRGNAVEHHQPGLVDAGGQGGQAEVRAHAEVGQHLHHRQRHTRRDRRARQRNRHLHHPAPQAGTQQAGGFHHVHAALAQRGAHQQVHVGVQAQHEQDHRAPQAAHVGPQRAFGAGGGAQRHLYRAAVLQEVGVGIGQHVSRHGQRQQQRPFKKAPARKLEQADGRRGGRTHHGHAHAHADGQHQRLAGITRQHRLRLVAQDLQRARVERQPRAQHAQHRQCQQGAQQRKPTTHHDSILFQPAPWLTPLRTLVILMKPIS